MINDEKGGFRAGRGCVNQIFTIKWIGEKAKEKKLRVYVGFIDLEKVYDRVNRKALWQVLRMYDVGNKLMRGIESMCVDISACIRVKRGESEQFRIDRGVRQGCIMFPWLVNVYMNRVMEEVKMGMGRRGVRLMEDGREWILPGFLYADGLGSR